MPQMLLFCSISVKWHRLNVALYVVVISDISPKHIPISLRWDISVLQSGCLTDITIPRAWITLEDSQIFTFHRINRLYENSVFRPISGTLFLERVVAVFSMLWALQAEVHALLRAVKCLIYCVSKGLLSTATGGHCTSLQPHLPPLPSVPLSISVTLSWISPFFFWSF